MFKKWYYRSPIFGIVAALLFYALGLCAYQLRLPKHQPTHFDHFITTTTANMIEFKVLEILKSDTYNHKYVARVATVDGIATKGNVLLSVQKDSCSLPLGIDQLIGIKAQIKPTMYAKNPNQFEYKTYLHSLNIYHQTRITYSEILQQSIIDISIRGTAEKAREFLINKLKKTPIPIRERAIIQALVLGQKRDVDKVLYQEFAAAGAVHILAVSGLHVGIIYLLLLIISHPLRFLKRGRIFQFFLIVIALWMYAYITGLSPSVCRAATMFSFLAFSKASNRMTNTANTLILSFVFLIVYNPLLLFHVGFQMSYAAVLAIISIQPIFNGYYAPRNYFKRMFWGILTVTFSAQIGVLPLSLYYFHQFPGLFFISNLVILPFLSIVLGGGILVIFLASINCTWDIVYLVYGEIVKQLNNFIGWVAHQESFLFKDIFFSTEMLLSVYIVIITGIVVWRKTSFKGIVMMLCSLLVVISVLYWQSKEDLKPQLVIFHTSRNYLIAIKEQRVLEIMASDTLNYSHTYPIKNYAIAKNISEIKLLKFQNVCRFRKQLLVIIDSTGVYSPKNKEAIIILTQSPKLNLERLIDSVQPSHIIADGNNYKTYVDRWRKTCSDKKIPFHSTYEKGAFILN